MEGPGVERSQDVLLKLYSTFFQGRRECRDHLASIISTREVPGYDWIATQTRFEEEGRPIDTWKMLVKLEQRICGEIALEDESTAIRLRGLCFDRQRWQDSIGHGRELGLNEALKGYTIEDVKTILLYLNQELSGVDQKVASVIDEHSSDPKFFLRELT